MTVLVNIIGAGHVGKTLGHLLVKHQLVSIGAICNASEASTLSAIAFIGQGKYCSDIVELPPADMTFITTPDDFILATSEELSKNRLIKSGSIVIHCSGSLTSDALVLMRERGCYVASVHPMRSFARPELSVAQYSGTYCALEGDSEALFEIRNLFNAIGSNCYEINKKKKSSYHAAGVFASNYLVTLAQQALLCMNDAGVEDDISMHVITNIMRGTVSNLEQTLSPIQSLTGPIKRGDVLTIEKHMESFTNMEQKDLYAALGNATLHLTNHDLAKKKQIVDALVID
jgi:predicted short-subunit dehydrogenase-like oxidoreductase (DUF2520 family)